MSSDAHAYGEGKPSIPATTEPTLIFMINRSLTQEEWDDIDVYRATQCAWVISDEARATAVYALGVSHGVVRGAFRIDGWRLRDTNRWCFDGRSARELRSFIGTSILRIKAPQGQANPVRWFPNGIPADGLDSST